MGIALRTRGPRLTPDDALSSKALMRRIAKDAVRDIVDRTKSGRDIHGRFFRAYSPQYAKWKGQRRVDLTLSGHMLDNVTEQRVTARGFRIWFRTQTARERARWHEGEGRVDRFFMGFSQRFADRALARIREHWQRHLK